MSVLNPEEQAVVETVAEWVDREVRPVVREMEHANACSSEFSTLIRISHR